MKTRYLLPVLGGLLLVAAQRSPGQAAGAKAPRYAPVREEVDLGEIARGKKARFEFRIRNTGKAPLSIELRPNCSCTVPTYDKVIAPGAVGRVVADLTTTGLKGYVTKTLSVKTNDPRRPTAGLYMIATIISVVDIEPSENFVMPLGDVGETVKRLTVRFRKGEAAEILDAVSTLPALNAVLEPLQAIDGRKAYKLTLTAAPTMPVGAYQARVTLRTSSATEPEIHLNIRCEKGIVATPPSIYLGVIAPKPAKPLVRMVTLKRHVGAVRVLKVTCSDPNLKVATRKLTDQSWRLTVTYVSGWTEGWVQRSIVVETDDTRQPRITIPVIARLGPSTGRP